MDYLTIYFFCSRNEKDESSGMPAASSMLTKSQSERRPDHLKLENTSPRRVNTVHGPSAATRSEQDRERSDVRRISANIFTVTLDIFRQPLYEKAWLT